MELTSTKNVSVDLLKNVEKQIAFNVPELKQLSVDQIQKIAEMVILENYKEEMKKDVQLMKFDYSELKELFLNNISKSNSENTRRSYSYAFRDFEKYISNIGIENPLSITSAAADDWIYNQRKENKSNSTVRRNVACLSSFFSFVERRSNSVITNKFRGTKARPEKKTTSKVQKFYCVSVNNSKMERLENDFNTIINNVENPEFKIIIKMMMELGLRCGSFQNMTIHGNTFKTVSKAKELMGSVPEDILKNINVANLKHNSLFPEWSSNKISCLFKYYTNKLYNSGLIDYKYSAHDLRHYFSLKQYFNDGDIYKLSKQLNHSNISITEQYLKGFQIAL